MPGSEIYNCDFHIHTPTSLDYKDRKATAKDIVDAALAKGLDAIAITDHNSHDGILDILEAAKDKGLTVFPGFELTANGGHIIAIFDPDTNLNRLDDALTKCGINKEMRSHEEAIGVWFAEALRIIVKEFDGITIAAHADGEKGFLKTIEQGQVRIPIYKDENLMAMEIVDLANLSKYLEGRERDYNRAMPCIQSSDSHRLADIGSRSTLIKIQNLSIKGLKHAFNSPMTRISFPGMKENAPYLRVKGIKVDRGFLADQIIEFNRNFNCLIGGTGSGKSTVIEFLRFALDQISEDEQIKKDSFGKLTDLAGIGSTINVILIDRDGEEYLVSRVFDGNENPIRIQTRTSVAPLDINPKDRFPVHAYSQGEALSIARNRRAQLELIDKHLVAELRTYQHEIRNAYGVLNLRIQGLTILDSKIRDRSSYKRDLALYEEQINTFNNELSKIKEIQRNSVVTSHQLWIEEKTLLSGLVNSIDTTRKSILSGFDDLELPILNVPFPRGDTPNKGLIGKCRAYASEIAELKKSAAELMSRGLDEIEARIKSEATLWKKSFEIHKTAYDDITAGYESTRTKELIGQIELYTKKKFDTQAKLNDIDLAEEEYKRLIEIRNKQIALIKDRKARIAALRERKAKEIVKTIPRLKIKLNPNGNRDEYKTFLQGAIIMQGSNQKPRIIESICNNIEPFQLAELLRANNYEQVETQASLGNWGAKVVEQLRSDPSISYKIETISTEDDLEISLDVGDHDFRPLEKLSTGQKAIVIISLSLVEGSTPILFDQPEDALYSPFIVEHIVTLVKASKDKRQFIFATHNPNIAVGPDLDLGIILDGSASKTSIKAAGGMDDSETNKLVVLYLEGGEQAIRDRLKEYGF